VVRLVRAWPRGRGLCDLRTLLRLEPVSKLAPRRPAGCEPHPLRRSSLEYGESQDQTLRQCV